MEAFVYKWVNHSLDKVYIGYHKGDKNDGYVCSSRSKEFWDDFKNPDHKWSREILFEGSAKDAIKFEVNSLNENDWKGDHCYNNCNFPQFHGDPERISIAQKKIWKEKLSDPEFVHWRKGKKMSKETREKMSKAKMGNTVQRGRKRSPETLAKMSKAQKGNTNGSANKGRVLSEEHIRNQAESQRGQKLYNNGKVTRKFHPGKEEEGFVLGSIRGQKLYNNGKVTRKFHPGKEEEGFVLGRLKGFSLK